MKRGSNMWVLKAQGSQLLPFSFCRICPDWTGAQSGDSNIHAHFSVQHRTGFSCVYLLVNSDQQWNFQGLGFSGRQSSGG